MAGIREGKNCYSTVGPLSGLKGEDLEEMILILAETHSTDGCVKGNLAAWCREVSRITQGHPMLVDIMVRNAHRFPDVERLKGITGVTRVEDQEAVNEVMKRLIQDTLTEEEQGALIQVSVFYVPVDESLSGVVGTEEVVRSIVDKGFLYWDQGRLVFTFDAVRELLEEKATAEHHGAAVRYYTGKIERADEHEKPDFFVEKLYHLIKGGRHEEASAQYFEGADALKRARGRAVVVSRLLLAGTREKEERTFILGTLGNLLSRGTEFSEAESCSAQALRIYRELAQRDPGAYEPDVATTLNNLGNLYWDLRDFTKAEKSYNEALEIRRRLAQRNPRVYGPDLVKNLHNLGDLYENQGNSKKGRKFHTEASSYQEKSPNDKS